MLKKKGGVRGITTINNETLGGDIIFTFFFLEKVNNNLSQKQAEPEPS